MDIRRIYEQLLKNKKLFGFVLAATVVVFVISAIGIGIAGYQFISHAGTKLPETTVSESKNLFLKAKENVLGDIITEGNDQAIKNGLSCFSMITGQDSKSILENLAAVTSNESLSLRAKELAATLPDSGELEHTGLATRLSHCVQAYMTQT